VRYEEARKAREQKKKVDDLKRELAWSHVASKEDELKAKLQEAEKAKRVVAKVESSLQEAKVDTVSFLVFISNYFLDSSGCCKHRGHKTRRGYRSSREH
jgi:hypothetical protein